MRRTGRMLGVLLAVAVAVPLSACVIAPTRVVADSEVTVVVDTEVTGLNPGSRDGAAAAALGLDAVLFSGFTTRDSRGRQEPDPSFGEMTVLAEDPLTVRFTIADSMVWSDGVPVDAVDLLLDWAAHSGHWRFFEAEGAVTASPAPPVVSADRKSLTVVDPRAGAVEHTHRFPSPVPAHVVAMHALGLDRQEVAKDAVIEAVEAAIGGEHGVLAKLARFWNGRFTTSADPAVLVSSGPYQVAGVEDGLLELRPNPRYAGDRRPQLESVRVATLPALDGVQALSVGEAAVLAIAQDAEARELVPSLGLRLLTGSPVAETLVAVQRQLVDGVEVGQQGRRVLWNVDAWTLAR